MLHIIIATANAKDYTIEFVVYRRHFIVMQTWKYDIVATYLLGLPHSITKLHSFFVHIANNNLAMYYKFYNIYLAMHAWMLAMYGKIYLKIWFSKATMKSKETCS